jgi:hypothetical protein
MPTFDTPGPIAVTVELGAGELTIVAGDRTDTVVSVRPSHQSRKADVAAAEATRVEYADGRLTVKAPRSGHQGWRQFSFRGGSESVAVEIALPAGSELRGEADYAALECTGRLGAVEWKTGAGNLRIERAGPVQLKTGAGDITVERIGDGSDVKVGAGAIRIGRIEGAAAIKNASGDTWIGEVAGDVSVSAAYGKIAVDHARGSVVAKTAYGDLLLGDLAGGSAVAETAFGKVEIGIRRGVAAWLDLNTKYGHVRNSLDASGQPGPEEDSVEVRAQTSYGDITVRRTDTAPRRTNVQDKEGR